MNELLVYYLDKNLDTDSNHNIISYIFEIIGCKVKYLSNPDVEQFHLYYGNNPAIAEKYDGIWIKSNSNDLIWNELIAGETKSNRLIEFDIFNAAKAFLSDSVHDGLDESAYDEHGRLLFSKSFKAENNIKELPIVNIYINFLKNLVDEYFDINLMPLFPQGKKTIIILSHDVDMPHKYGLLKNYRIFPPNRNFKQVFLYHIEFCYLLIKFIFDKNRDENWVFDEVIDSEKKFNFKSTFFFAATHNNKKGAFFKDVDYNLNWKEFLDVFDRIKENGFEAGLHAGYNAYKKFENIFDEKNALDNVCGVRHHFWHLGKDYLKTLQMHQKANMLYDSSLAYNNDPGFRNSAALPFYPLYAGVENPGIMEIPSFLMDGNLFYDGKLSVKQATDKAIDYITRVKENGGVGAIDWHVRTSFPKSERFKEWGETYQNILHYLADQPDIWVTNFKESFDWFNERRKKLYS